MTVDYKDNEGRDAVALIDWLAKQPEAQLDKAGDPRVGMHGASYAGGIEWVTAAIDKRVDAIAPAISWHSLLTSLYREDLAKTGWGSALYGAGLPAANAQGGGLDPHITSSFTSGLATGHFSPADRAWFDSRGPGDALVNQVRVPTLMLQGTADTLFSLSESMRNDAILRKNGVPHKLIWFCGGHGTCLTGAGPAGRLEKATVAWLRRHLAGQSSVGTGPGFEWLADDAQWRSTPAFPPPSGAPLTARGSGTLVLNPADATSGTPVAAAAGDQRGERPDPAAGRGDAGGRRAQARADLQRHRLGDGHARAGADRRRGAQRRARQPGHADPGHARRQVAHRHTRRSRASRRRSARARATACR